MIKIAILLMTIFAAACAPELAPESYLNAEIEDDKVIFIGEQKIDEVLLLPQKFGRLTLTFTSNAHDCNVAHDYAGGYYSAQPQIFDKKGYSFFIDVNDREEQLRIQFSCRTSRLDIQDASKIRTKIVAGFEAANEE